jgi:predicted acylesterase/phospholipase RssA
MVARSKSIALALSGGGLRATLFHLGVIRNLFDRGLLPCVSHITAVSGGSILAAHLALHWDRYTACRKSFESAASEVIRFARCDLRGRVMRPWLFSWLFPIPYVLTLRMFAPKMFRRVELLRANYERLLGKRCLGDLCRRSNAPSVYLLASSMTTGHVVSFGGPDALVRFEIDGADPLIHSSAPQAISAAKVSLAFAVAASSAFPPVFPPMRLSAGTLGVSREAFPNEYLLTDGGVLDNLGIRKLLWIAQQSANDWPFDHLIISNAERGFEPEFRNDFEFIVNRTSRAVDLMMNRISHFEEQALLGRAVSYVNLADAVEIEAEPTALDKDVVYRVHRTRTDLDDFSRVEINAIVRHGWSMCNEKTKQISPKAQPQPGQLWQPYPRNAIDPNKMRYSHTTRYGLFRGKHWATWAFWAAVIFWGFVAPVGLSGWFAIRARNAESGQARAIVGDQVRLVQRLALLATSPDIQSWDRNLALWERLTRELAEEPWFRREREMEEQDWAEGLRVGREAVQARGEARRLVQSVERMARRQAEQIRRQGQRPTQVLEEELDMTLSELLLALDRMSRPGTRHHETPYSRQVFRRFSIGILQMARDNAQMNKAIGTLRGELQAWAQAAEEPVDKREGLRNAIDSMRLVVEESLAR